MVELVREAVLVEPARRRPMSAQGGLAYGQCASEGLLCAYFPRSDVTSAFVFLLRNGMVDACMIGGDSVVNARDLHTAIAQQVFQMPKGRQGRTRSMPSKRIPSALDLLSDWPLRSICTIASI